MSMRSQVYEWDASRGTALTVATNLGKENLYLCWWFR